MSDTARPKVAGNKLSAAEINGDLPVQINAGEAIDVSSNPQAVYLKDSDGEVYKTDSDATDTTFPFIGFALTTGSDGSACTIQKNGVVGGFTGLDAGKAYYLSGTAGAISTSVGTYIFRVGYAISTTELLISVGQKIYKGTISDVSPVSTSDAGVNTDTAVTHNFGSIPSLIIINCRIYASGQTNGYVAFGQVGYYGDGTVAFANVMYYVDSGTTTETYFKNTTGLYAGSSLAISGSGGYLEAITVSVVSITGTGFTFRINGNWSGSAYGTSSVKGISYTVIG